MNGRKDKGSFLFHEVEKICKRNCFFLYQYNSDYTRHPAWHSVSEIFMPFVIGWFIALIANPLVRILERKLKVARKHTSMLLIIAVLAAIVGAFYLIGSKTAEEVGILIDQAPEIYSSIREDFQDAGKNLDKLLEELPESVQESVDDFEKSIGEVTADAVGKLSQITVNQAGDIAKSLPSILISIIFLFCLPIFYCRQGQDFGIRTSQYAADYTGKMAAVFRQPERGIRRIF